MTEAIREQAQKRKHRRYGDRQITTILCQRDWIVNHKRVYRIWRREDLRVPQKRQTRKRYNGNGRNACDRRPPEYVNHIWSYDTIEDRLENGRKVRILNVMDEFTREGLASEVAFRITAYDVMELLRYLFLVRGCPVYLRGDNGSLSSRLGGSSDSWRTWASLRCSSSRAVPGRMVAQSLSTAACVTNFSMASCSYISTR